MGDEPVGDEDEAKSVTVKMKQSELDEVDVPLDAALSTLENLHMSTELDLGSLRENAQKKGLI